VEKKEKSASTTCGKRGCSSKCEKISQKKKGRHYKKMNNEGCTTS